MALQPLVTLEQAFEWGFTGLDPFALLRASARIRGHLRQQVTLGTSTITARGPVFRLPQRPVVTASTVTDGAGNAVAFTRAGSLLTVESLDLVSVTYTHGYTTLPDELVELCCQVAQRLGTPNEPLAQGVQQQTAPGFSVGYGWDAWKAQSGLTQGEKDALRRYWPPLPDVISAGPAAQ